MSTESQSSPKSPPPSSPRQRLKAGLRPRFNRSQFLAGILCALLGFALVLQVRQTGGAELSALRQDDLVRLLDDVTTRADQLQAEVDRLEASRAELASGVGDAQAALEVARQRATFEGILSGRLPAMGPGVRIELLDPNQDLRAQHLFNMLEEIRNAGGEVVEVNGMRLVTSSSFIDIATGISLDGTALSAPYVWYVIGDPQTLDRALEIPGGAMSVVRNQGATADLVMVDEITIEATVELSDPQFAQPVS